MLNLLWLIPFLPLAGFLILAGAQGRLPRPWDAWVGAGSVGLAALLAAGIGLAFSSGAAEHPVFRQLLWNWMAVDSLRLSFAFYLDALSLTMLFVVTGVGFLIHVYSIGYMADDPSRGRFFAYMNLFVFAMLILVLADSLPLLYLGWEGVGLCSYLLIGFWHEKPENGYAARKAFVVTRVGDAAMALGLFLLFAHLDTLDIQLAMQRASAEWPAASRLPETAALLLLGGAVGKSAQLPLQTWLPDAMAGPTPISALIHAATMVTAGVYLIARAHVLFDLAPQALHLVAAIGAVGLVLAGFCALTQTDIKRILAYSTMSQIGYMFLALGAGAWSAAIFHLMTHAFFKALLFLGAGAVILSLHHEQDVFKMGGLWKRLPLTFWTFLVGAAALAALPLTSGYWSKHDILLAAYAADVRLWGAGVFGAFLTGLYTTRLMLVAFFGPAQGHRAHEKENLPKVIVAPLALLAALSLAGGLLETNLNAVFPEAETHHAGFMVGLCTQIAPFLGILLGYLFYGARIFSADALANHPATDWLGRWWRAGWGFDLLYEFLLVRPFAGLARLNRRDVADKAFLAVAAGARGGFVALSSTQTGRLRWYGAAMLLGAALTVALGVLA
jgi:NADH-quinone oxidoreductase subunit L